MIGGYLGLRVRWGCGETGIGIGRGVFVSVLVFSEADYDENVQCAECTILKALIYTV